MTVKFEKYAKINFGFNDDDFVKHDPIEDEDRPYKNERLNDMLKVWVFQVRRMISIQDEGYDPLGPVGNPKQAY